MLGVAMTWIMLICVIVALLFVGNLIRVQDEKNQLVQLHQTTELWAESFNIRLSADIERLSQLSSNVDRNLPLKDNLLGLSRKVRSVIQGRHEILEVNIVDADKLVRASIASPGPFGDITLNPGSLYDREETYEAIERSIRTGAASFSRPYSQPLAGSPFVDLVINIRIHSQPLLVISRLSLWELVRTSTSKGPASDFRVSLLYNGQPIVIDTTDSHRESIKYNVHLAPLPANFALQVSSYAQGLITQNTLFWVISALGVFLIVALLGLIRFNWRQNNTETALRAETALRKTIADSELSGLQVTDRSGRIIYANKTFADIMALKNPDDLIGQMPPYSYWPQGEAGFRLSELLEAIMHGQIHTASYEFQPVKPDGSTFYAFLRISPMNTVDGKQLGWLWTLTDISEIRRAQERVTAAHERFTLVLESMQDAISVVDTQSDLLLFSNTAYDRLFGENSKGHLYAHTQFAQNPTANTADVYFEDLELWFEVHERIITWTDRTDVRLQILSDITERRKNEMLLVEQQARSELNSRLVTMGEMASSLAHELNQPLAAISNYAFVVASLMKKAGVPEDHEMFYSINRIESQAERAAGIIRRIRSFTRRSEPKMELIGIDHLLNEVKELATIQARRYNAKVSYFIAPDVQTVWCDEIMIEQVLLNLIKNGIEASANIEGRKPEVSLTIYQNTLHHVVFEVADNGTGIPDENKEHLFDPFFTTKSAGMGMGLNICRTIVELHHGRLTISDNIGQGTIFTLTLPAQDEKSG